MVELQVARALEDEDLAAFYDEIPKEMFGDEDVSSDAGSPPGPGRR